MAALLDDTPRHRPRRRCGRAPVPADQGPRQAGRLLRRALPHHRLHPEQLHQLGPAAHLHRHPVQVAVAQPAHPHGLEHRLGGARRVHRDPAAAEARRRALVSGHRRRGLPEPLLDHPRELRVTSSSCPATTSTRWTTRSMLRFHQERGADVTLAAIEVPLADGHALRHRRRSTRTSGSPASWRSRRIRPPMPGLARPRRSPRWASTSSTPTCWCSALEDDAASRQPPRLRQGHHPGADPRRRRSTPTASTTRTRRPRSTGATSARSTPTTKPTWTCARSTRSSTSTTRSGRCAPTSRRRRRRSSCSPKTGRRCGQALDSVISPGCIVSGSSIYGSMLCPNVRVHSFCHIEQSILMPGVRVGRHARIRRAIIDRDVLIPRGALIGYNPEEDRRRHTVTEGGVVVVTADDEPLIGPISEEALRYEAEADRRGSRRRIAAGSVQLIGETAVKITRVHGREILDSRGNPTVEVDVTLDGGALRPRRRAVRRVHRRARGARTARRRQGALSAARACARRSPTSTARSPTALIGKDARSARDSTRR